MPWIFAASARSGLAVILCPRVEVVARVAQWSGDAQMHCDGLLLVAYEAVGGARRGLLRPRTRPCLFRRRLFVPSWVRLPGPCSRSLTHLLDVHAHRRLVQGVADSQRLVCPAKRGVTRDLAGLWLSGLVPRRSTHDQVPARANSINAFGWSGAAASLCPTLFTDVGGGALPRDPRLRTVCFGYVAPLFLYQSELE